MKLTPLIRKSFLNYFQKQGHLLLPSSPVLPQADPTLLFTNAGMNQFKDLFLGQGLRNLKRAATSQKCIRVGGKHNDLDQVGHTQRHLTFFEMLGNFSFGDYFKKEAIQFAWEVATEVFELDPKRIWPTVFREDDEAFELWLRFVPVERITRLDEKDNFWSMGETGPCGPCSELLYDRGETFGSGKNPKEDPSGERFLEFWNLVFMEFNRKEDGSLEKLPKPSIDTGAGLERLVGLKMGVSSVFETDLFHSLIQGIASLTHLSYSPQDKKAAAFHVIADHLRCLAFAIADGVQPSNIERGYVLRKVLRRAVRYGRYLGLDKPFLAHLLPILIEEMGPDYPELLSSQTQIQDILTAEEEAFFRTLRRGGNLLNQIIETSLAKSHLIQGKDAFKLKDTYGFPIEEILLLAKDSGLTVDIQTFEKLEKEAKLRSKTAHKTTKQTIFEGIFEDFIKNNPPSLFLGYEQLETPCHVIGIVKEGVFVQELQEGEEGTILLNHTPFYPEMGGQVGDLGDIQSPSAVFQVDDCKVAIKGVILHKGKQLQGKLKKGEAVLAKIDQKRRFDIANNHTATHLLHFALCQVLGEHIKQAGSVVDSVRLRFDFNHHKALSQDEIYHIEQIVNEKIRENVPVKAYETSYEEVQKDKNIKQFFGEKYETQVRVIDIDFSKELCGGTHARATGHIGLFKILKESSISAGVRRIEAISGFEAEKWVQKEELFLHQLAKKLKTPVPLLQEKVEKLLQNEELLSQKLKAISQKQLEDKALQLLAKKEEIHGVPFIAVSLEASKEELKTLADLLIQKTPSAILILACIEPPLCHIVVRVTDDLVKKGLLANQIIQTLSFVIDGNGGGKPQAAQAAGKQLQQIPNAFLKAKKLVSDALLLF